MTELDLNENIIVVAKYGDEMISVSRDGKELTRDEYSVDGDLIVFLDGYADTMKMLQGEGTTKNLSEV